MTRLWRTLVSVLIAFVATGIAIGLAAAPAAAHTVSGQGATNFRTAVRSVTPRLPGLAVETVELGARMQLTWTGPDDLIVEGDSGEPYLRVGPTGIFRNRRSPATYVNQTAAGVAISPEADPKAPPDWVRIGSGRTVLWRDHRSRWTGGAVPLAVRQSPGTFHPVFQWTIGLAEGGRHVSIVGAVDWVPGVSARPRLAVIALLAVVGLVGGMSRRWALVLLAVTTLTVAVDVVHVVGTGLAFAGSGAHRLLLTIGSSYYSIVAWVLGVVAIRLLARRSVDGLFAAVFTGLVVGIFGGLTDIGSLTHSQVPFDFGAATARWLVAISIGGSLGLVLGSTFAFRRNRPRPVPGDEAPSASLPDPGAASAPV